ncbi:MAG: class II aldolase/adducin family protein [Lachnospiraceae bacterium]|nr:class II aldolase/adducin family protein [Lachnospiraceae bacterium]
MHREDELADLFSQAEWIGKQLFERNKVSGSSANMSFRHDDKIYITGSGTCFGNLNRSLFAICNMTGKCLNNVTPSKELPLHLMMYMRDKTNVNAVIHTHSFYSTLWSCLESDEKDTDVFPQYTPYLKMKLGKIVTVPYGKPGSEELFRNFRNSLTEANGYLLRNHGPVVVGKTLMDAFYCLEEMEESAHLAWELSLTGSRAKRIKND